MNSQNVKMIQISEDKLRFMEMEIREQKEKIQNLKKQNDELRLQILKDRNYITDLQRKTEEIRDFNIYPAEILYKIRNMVIDCYDGKIGDLKYTTSYFIEQFKKHRDYVIEESNYAYRMRREKKEIQAASEDQRLIGSW